MIVTCYENRFGHLEIDPVNERKREKLVNALVEVGLLRRKNADECLIYLQHDYDVSEFYSQFPAVRRNVKGGWHARARIPDELVYAYCGLS
jgi:hypothetical protein